MTDTKLMQKIKAYVGSPEWDTKNMTDSEVQVITEFVKANKTGKNDLSTYTDFLSALQEAKTKLEYIYNSPHIIKHVDEFGGLRLGDIVVHKVVDVKIV